MRRLCRLFPPASLDVCADEVVAGTWCRLIVAEQLPGQDYFVFVVNCICISICICICLVRNTIQRDLPAQLVGHVEISLLAGLLRQTLKLIDEPVAVVFKCKPGLLFFAQTFIRYIKISMLLPGSTKCIAKISVITNKIYRVFFFNWPSAISVPKRKLTSSQS